MTTLQENIEKHGPKLKMEFAKKSIKVAAATIAFFVIGLAFCLFEIFRTESPYAVQIAFVCILLIVVGALYCSGRTYSLLAGLSEAHIECFGKSREKLEKALILCMKLMDNAGRKALEEYFRQQEGETDE